jgi:hypothetical protein
MRALIKRVVFWIATSNRPAVGSSRCSWETYCFHLQGEVSRMRMLSGFWVGFRPDPGSGCLLCSSLVPDSPPSLQPTCISLPHPQPAYSNPRGNLILRNVKFHLQGYVESQLRNHNSKSTRREALKLINAVTDN